MIGGVGEQALADGAGVGETIEGACRSASLANRGEQQRDENRDDGNHDQEFNQREGAAH